MKKGYLYTILFAFMVALLFSSVLGGMNAFYREKIDKNARISEKKAILDSLNIDYEDTVDSVEGVFENSVQSSKIRTDNPVYEMIGPNDSIEAYSVGFTGKGLWGTISGYIGVNFDLDKIIRLQFTEQNETPGLGGRITEDDFLNQFNDLKVDLSSSIEYGDDIQAITGATASSNAVLNIINKFIQHDLRRLEESKNE